MIHLSKRIILLMLPLIALLGVFTVAAQETHRLFLPVVQVPIEPPLPVRVVGASGYSSHREVQPKYIIVGYVENTLDTTIAAIFVDASLYDADNQKITDISGSVLVPQIRPGSKEPFRIELSNPIRQVAFHRLSVRYDIDDRPNLRSLPIESPPVINPAMFPAIQGTVRNSTDKPLYDPRVVVTLIDPVTNIVKGAYLMDVPMNPLRPGVTATYERWWVDPFSEGWTQEVQAFGTIVESPREAVHVRGDRLRVKSLGPSYRIYRIIGEVANLSDRPVGWTLVLAAPYDERGWEVSRPFESGAMAMITTIYPGESVPFEIPYEGGLSIASYELRLRYEHGEHSDMKRLQVLSVHVDPAGNPAIYGEIRNNQPGLVSNPFVAVTLYDANNNVMDVFRVRAGGGPGVLASWATARFEVPALDYYDPSWTVKAQAEGKLH